MKMFTFYENRVFVPAMIPYSKLLAIKKNIGTKQMLTYKISWLRTLAFFNQEWSYQDLYNWAKRQKIDLEDQFILDSLRKFKKDVKSLTEDTELNKQLICMPRYFVWNNPAIWKEYKTKEEVAKYKNRIVLQYNKSRSCNRKTEMVLEQVNNDPTLSIIELVEKLKGKVSRTTIMKIVKENNIALPKKSRLYSLIDKKLNDLFNYKYETVKSVLTYKLLSDWIGVKELEIKRFMKDNPEYKLRYQSLNRSLRETLKTFKDKDRKRKSGFDF